jgi:hypothetical protein
MRRQLHLNLFIHSRGHHEASWHPAASPLPLTDIRYQDMAQRAGRAVRLDLPWPVARSAGRRPAARTWPGPSPCLRRWRYDPPDRDDRHGVDTYTEPFNLARQFASLDHISNGRVTEIVTTWLATAAGNFGGTAQVATPIAMPRRGVHGRGQGAVGLGRRCGHRRRAGGERYARADRIRPINHKGEHYRWRGR